MLSPGRAVAEALWYCRDRGLACRTDGARLTRGSVWRVRLDVAGWRHRESDMVVDLDAWSGEILAVHGHPGWGRRWNHGRWDRD